MKKVTCLMLMAMVICFVPSCSTKQTAKNSDGTPVLTWYVPGDKQEGTAEVLAEANKIIRPTIGADVSIQFIDAGAFQEKMNMIMASGEVYDLAFVGYLNDYKTAARKGGLLDITDMLPEYAPDLIDNQVIRDYAWDSARFNERLYAVPNMQVIASCQGVFVQKELAQKYGFDADDIKTIEDIEPFLAQIKENEPDIYPYRNSQGAHPFIIPVYESIGKTISIRRNSSDKELVNSFFTEEQFETAKKIRDWYLKGYIRKDALSVGDDTTDFNGGKYAVATGVVKPGCEAELKTATGIEWVSATFASVPPILETSTNTMIGISKTSKNPEKSLQFINLINTNKELYNLICFGIEGKHYTIEDQRVNLVEKSAYAPNASWKFGNQFNALIMEGQELDVWQKTMQLNDSAERSYFAGVTIDESSIATELAQLETIANQYLCISKGSDDPESYWDAYVGKLKAAGVDKVFEVEKSQVLEQLMLRD